MIKDSDIGPGFMGAIKQEIEKARGVFDDMCPGFLEQRMMGILLTLLYAGSTSWEAPTGSQIRQVGGGFGYYSVPRGHKAPALVIDFESSKPRNTYQATFFPQKHVPNSAGTYYIPDFLGLISRHGRTHNSKFHAVSAFTIECEGVKHQEKNKREIERRYSRLLGYTVQGYNALPFSYDRITQEPSKVRHMILEYLYHSIGHNLLQREGGLSLSGAA